MNADLHKEVDRRALNEHNSNVLSKLERRAWKENERIGVGSRRFNVLNLIEILGKQNAARYSLPFKQLQKLVLNAS